MFRLLRLFFVVAAAFFAGLIFERSQAADACRALGGESVRGICRGASQ